MGTEDPLHDINWSDDIPGSVSLKNTSDCDKSRKAVSRIKGSDFTGVHRIAEYLQVYSSFSRSKHLAPM
jgi:hypothetical protein